MNNQSNDTGFAGEARFDRALRQHHATAVDSLSPRTRAQLAQRRNAALRDERGERGEPARGMRFAATGFAAICALAIGLQFGMVPAPGTPAGVTVSATTSDTGAVGGATMLDEDPEFYAWLVSTDAQQIAME